MRAAFDRQLRPRLHVVSAISLLWLGSLAGSGCAFLTQILLARNLAPAGLGAFAAALNIVTLVAPLASFGLGGFWLRTFGQEGWQAERWLRPSLRYAIVTTATVMAGLMLWAFFGPHDERTRWLLVILSCHLLGFVAVELVSSKLQLEARYRSLALWQFFPHFVRLALIATLALAMARLLRLQDVVIVYALTAGAVSGLGIRYLWQMRQGRLQLHGHGQRPDSAGWPPPPTATQVMAEAWPFGMAGLFHLIYYQIDIVLLKYLQGDDAAGVYNVAFVVMGAVYLLPSVVYQKFLLPKIHRWANHDRSRFVQVYRTGSLGMLGIGLAAMALIWTSAPLLVNLLFGPDYTAAAAALQILAFAIPMRFVSTAVGSTLTTQDHMKTKVKLMGCVAIINISLNLFLIPRYGILGSASATVFSEAVLLILYYAGSRKYVFNNI
jgi:O-antigen/teichoic acid export membrane protein